MIQKKNFRTCVYYRWSNKDAIFFCLERRQKTLRPFLLGGALAGSGVCARCIGAVKDKYILVQSRKEQWDSQREGRWDRRGLLCQVDFSGEGGLAEMSVLSESIQ